MNAHAIGNVSSSSEFALKKAEWQNVLFDDIPSRLELAKLKPSWPCKSIKIRIHRNHAFEPVASVLNSFLAFQDLYSEISYSDYDDSLSFSFPKNEKVDLELIWLDYDRYKAQHTPQSLADWLLQRLSFLRSITPVPILVCNGFALDSMGMAFNTLIEEQLGKISSVRLCSLQEIVTQLGAACFDERAVSLSGTRLSNSACVLIARWLGCRWIPATLKPRLKAIVVDLDNTLYAGVLGEDGPEGVVLLQEHQEIHKQLLSCKTEGVFLALCSRNEPSDVDRLFQIRRDFPLGFGDFATSFIGWESKAEGIARIGDDLRVGVDSILFVDDNPGELASVANHLPMLQTLHVDPDGLATSVRALRWYPGLWTWGITAEDKLRLADLKANEERLKLASLAQNNDEYLLSLQVQLTFYLDPISKLGRLHELSRKTNQFNLNLQRLSETELIECIRSPQYAVVAVQLCDRLTDSGVIGVVVGHYGVDAIEIKEFCLSCRSLGRGMESIIIEKAIELMSKGEHNRRVAFHYRTGQRNAPALQWLEKTVQQPLREAEGVCWGPKDYGYAVSIPGSVSIQVVQEE